MSWQLVIKYAHKIFDKYFNKALALRWVLMSSLINRLCVILTLRLWNLNHKNKIKFILLKICFSLQVKWACFSFEQASTSGGALSSLPWNQSGANFVMFHPLLGFSLSPPPPFALSPIVGSLHDLNAVVCGIGDYTSTLLQHCSLSEQQYLRKSSGW